MSVRTYVGSFAKRTGTGTQAITGVGFIPKALFFWSGAATVADGGFENVDCQQLNGITDGTNSVGLAHISGDGLTTSNTAFGYYNTAPLVVVDLGATLNSLGVLTSMDSDGFTLNWTTATGASGILIHFLAIGGAGVQAHVGDIATNGSTGAQSVTGVGFQPTAVLLLGFPPTSGAPIVFVGFGPTGIGLATATDQVTLDCDTVEPRNPSETTRYQRTDRCIAARGAAGVSYQASLTSLDSDGFTVNWDIARAGRLAYLALAGIETQVGALTQPVATGTHFTATTFAPQALLCLTTGQAASTSIQNQNRLSIGATDGTRQRVDFTGDNNAVSPTQCARYDATTSLIVAATPSGSSGTIDAQAAFAGFDDSGFSLDWTTVAGSAPQVLYLALGAPSTSGRNLLTGYHHTVTGSDNLLAGRENTITGQSSQAHGQSMTVTARLGVGFGLDGSPHTLSADGTLAIYGDFEATGATTLDAIAAPAAQTYAVTVDDTGLLSSQVTTSGTVTHTGALTSGTLIQGNGAADVTLNAMTATVTKLTAGVPSAASAGTDYTNLAFKTISVSGQSDVVADSAADTLTLVAGTNVTITTNAATDAITINASGGGGSGTVTTTGSPASGNLTAFSGATSIVNGDLSGDVTTSGALVATLANTAVTPGTYTNSVITVDAQGRLTAAANGASGTYGLLAYTSYNPVTSTTTTTTSTTGADIDATNLSVTFTVPSSGIVLVRLTGLAVVNNNASGYWWCLRSTGAANIAGTLRTVYSVSAGMSGQSMALIVSGLTPAATVTYRWGHGVSTNNGSLRYGDDGTTGGHFGPAVMEVWSS